MLTAVITCFHLFFQIANPKIKSGKKNKVDFINNEKIKLNINKIEVRKLFLFHQLILLKKIADNTKIIKQSSPITCT